MKKVSLGSWAFAFGPYAARPVPFDAVAKRLAEAGYDAIEVCGIQEHVTLDRYATKEARQEVKTLLDGLGLGVSGYACDQYSADPTEAANKQKYLDLFARNLEMCADLGSGDIRVDTVAPPNLVEGFVKIGTQMTEEWVAKAGGDAKAVVDAYNAAQKIAKAD